MPPNDTFGYGTGSHWVSHILKGVLGWANNPGSETKTAISAKWKSMPAACAHSLRDRPTGRLGANGPAVDFVMVVGIRGRTVHLLFADLAGGANAPPASRKLEPSCQLFFATASAFSSSFSADSSFNGHPAPAHPLHPAQLAPHHHVSSGKALPGCSGAGAMHLAVG